MPCTSAIKTSNIKTAKLKITTMKTSADRRTSPRGVRRDSLRCQEDSDENELPPPKSGRQDQIPSQDLPYNGKYQSKVEAGNDQVPPQKLPHDDAIRSEAKRVVERSLPNVKPSTVKSACLRSPRAIYYSTGEYGRSHFQLVLCLARCTPSTVSSTEVQDRTLFVKTS